MHQHEFKVAAPRVAAGALFRDDEGRVLLVHPVDKLLFIFDGGRLDQVKKVRLDPSELDEQRCVQLERLEEFVPARLCRRIRTALAARISDEPAYAERGSRAGTFHARTTP